jgi:hypothetical protein
MRASYKLVTSQTMLLRGDYVAYPVMTVVSQLMNFAGKLQIYYYIKSLFFDLLAILFF